jgi:hypothetical protein
MALWFLRNTSGGRFRALAPSSKPAGPTQEAVALGRVRIQPQPTEAG